MENSDTSDTDELEEESIAIVGMSGRFPGAKNLEEFWHNLKNGVESIRFFSDHELLAAGIEPAVLADPHYVKANGLLDNVAEFDAAFFDINPREAEILDPQQRLFLECAWEALEHAGYDPKTYSGAIGVYGGMSSNTYLEHIYANPKLIETVGSYPILTGNDKDFLCTRVSYKLNLSGPSVTVQTACSTSLVAVVMGCKSLFDYQCDMVLAGGVSISLPMTSGYFYQEGMIMSPDGHCRAFDAKAQGTVGGNGVGIVVLKRLEEALNDGDTIHAVIKGAAINNDGALKIGYTAPSVEAQARVIVEALTLADVSPETISYVEAHGTGTPLGDPVEMAALNQAFRTQTDKKGYCAIGSLKTNVGHLDAAAGVAGLIKTVLALKHQILPPSLHFETPNPQLDLANSPFYVNAKLSEWQTNDFPRRAGVSSFGIGGTNAHLILEEAPKPPSETDNQQSNRPWQLVLLSAKTDTALETATTQLLEHLKQHPDLNLADVAYTYQVGRHVFDHRRMLVCQTLEDAMTALSTREVSHTLDTDEEPSVVFMFAGQGAQYVNMGLELYQTERAFRDCVDRCAAFLQPHLGLDLRTVLYPTIQLSPLATEQPLECSLEGGDLTQTAITQPALFVIEYALAQLWRAWGVQPKAMIGHSIGEYVAACLAGVFTLEEALVLVAARGRLMQSVAPGAMLAVPLSEPEIHPLLNKNIDLAAINVPSQCVVSGTQDAIEQFAAQLAEQGLECQRLQTSHAFHSEMMSPILPRFLEQVQKIHLKLPKIPFLSNVTGNWISATDATSPQYWVTHLRQTVRFAAGLQHVLKEPHQILLEIGPGRTLSTFARRHPDNAGQLILTSLRHPKDEQSDSAFLLQTLGQLWMANMAIDWSGFYADEQRQRLPLPTYPFERQRYWAEPQQSATQAEQSQQFWHSVIAAGQKQAQQGKWDTPSYLAKKACLERLCVAYMGKALKDLGAFSSPTESYSLEALFELLNIQPRYQQLVSRWLHVLVEHGQLQQDGESFTHLQCLTTEAFQTLSEEAEVNWADDPNRLWRVQYYGDNLTAVLTDKLQALELFSQELGISATTTEEHTSEDENSLVQESPVMQYYNTIARATMQQVVNLLPHSAKLNILEIGGGSGYTTSALLPILPAQQTQYIFTDISRLLVNRAEPYFSDYPFVQYRVLDIEQSPQEQGYALHRFDVVIAVNVLHVTRNMAETLTHVRSLLAPGGLLLLWEITQPQLDFDITDALLMNRIADGERNQGNPFLATAQWSQALLAHGFVEMVALPETEVIGHHILVAQADSSGKQTAAFRGGFEQPEIVKKTPQVSLSKQPDIADWFYLPSWKQSMLSATHREPSVESCILVFSNACGLCSGWVQHLERQGQDVVNVKIGATFTKLNERLYTLNPQHADDYEALLQELQKRAKHPRTIVHFWMLTPDEAYTESRFENLAKYQDLGFYSLFLLAQACGKQNVTQDIQIAVVSNHLQPVIGSETLCPEKASVLGPVRVIPQEYQNITCRSIDVVLPESGSAWEKKLIDQLLVELATPSSDQIIAYRGNHRWVQTFEPCRLEHPVATIPPRLRERGVYLITGGLGGIGLVLAEYLAKTVSARLILIGRSDFPSRDEWSGWLTTHHAENSLSRKIRKIQEIEQLGAAVLVVTADVTHQPQMQAVITQAQAQFGQIQGVIHAAGVFPSGTIQRKTPEMVERIFAPKVLGTLVLDSVLADCPLDFMMLCSSLSAILGGIVDHCAANAFMDAFAYYNTYQCERFTVSINWDGWQEVGQAAEAAKQPYDGTSVPTPAHWNEKEVAHPLFDKCIIEGTQQSYVTHFSVLKHWVLNEHRVMGKPTLPGTAYLEMARAAFAETHANHGALEIREVYFLMPLTVGENDEVEVRTLLKPIENQGVEFVVISKSDVGQEQWLEHARGQLFSLAAEEPPIQYDIQNLEALCGEEEIIDTGTEWEGEEQFVKVGPRWHNVEWIKIGPNQGLAFLTLPTAFAADLETFKLHPALIDSATGFANVKQAGHYLPFSYKKLVIKGPLPTKVYSYITFHEDNQSQTDTQQFNITLMDERGTGWVEIEGYTLRRIAVEKAQKTPTVPESQNFCLEIASPGLLDSLTFRPAPRQKPGLGEVEIEVSTVGLNFKEVLIALGMISVPTDTLIKFGYECVGKIVAIGEDVKTFQIGDEVIAFAPASFSAFTTTLASFVALKPDNLSFEEAATIPVAFGTAYYALIKLARLYQGERILIHAAAGGVGMAAVKIAQWVGADIFATAGNPEKRAFLHSLGIQYVMDSRSLAFANEVMEYTDGKGVNVVLNSLGGEFIQKSLETLAPFGRFLELGVRDIYNNTQLGLRPFEKGLAYFALGVGQEIPNFNAIFQEVVQHFKEGHFSPLPHRVFPITEVASAFKYMAQAKHIGKVVVSIPDKDSVIKLVCETPTVHRSDKSNLGSTNSLGSVLPEPKKPSVVTNILYQGIKEYILPSEGVEVFNRILDSQLPQILVSTIDLPARLEGQDNLSTLLNDWPESEPATRLAKPAHSRPQLSQAYAAPRNEFEQQLANIWQEFLGIAQIGIYDDFFQLGGDSLIAVQLIAKLRHTLQTELSPHSLLNSPTIAALAESVQPTLDSSAPQQALPSLLVEIQAGNRLKSPLFLIHPIGGHVYFYRDLANDLGPNQPVYGIQAQGLEDNAEPLTKIEDMATLYIKILRVRQPEGPYFLGGSSLGGMIAFEMAQQLNALGQPVALLTMVDTPGPGQMPAKLETDVEILAYMLNVGANIPVSVEELRQLEPDEQLRYFMEQLQKIEQQMSYDLDIAQLRHSIFMFKVNAQAMWDYQPQVYPGQIIFFRAQEKDAYNAKAPELAWRALAAGGVEIHEVPGNHITMNYPPHIKVMADLLKGYLDKE